VSESGSDSLSAGDGRGDGTGDGTGDSLDISVVIPVYDEAGCLSESVRVASDLLERVSAGSWEIVLVDDGSSDNTGALISELTAADARIKGAFHEQNQGKGAAIRTGVALTCGERVLFSDADLSTPFDTLVPFLGALDQGADIVVGNRKSREATIDRKQPWLRVKLGLGFTWLSNAMAGLSISDYTCGFKLFRGAAARQLFAQLETPRWCFDTEILARAVRQGLVIREVPVHWHHVDDTRVRVGRDVIGSFVELLAIRRRVKRLPRNDPPK
jgi:dolichyl-phosphate beta-glucosyltransferase